MITKTHPIEIRAADLKLALPGLGKLIPRTPSLPVLGCVKVEAARPKALRLTATDLDLALSVEVPAKVEKGLAPFLLPLSRLREQLSGLRSDDVVSLGPTAKSPPVDELPEVPRVRAPGLTLPDPAVASLLRAFACASQDPARAVLCSACLDTSGAGENAHRIVGTNGRILFSSNSMHLPLKQSAILPDHPLWRWKPLADSRPWTLRLGKDKHGAGVFRMEGRAWSATGRLLDGRYPDYRQVIPGASRFTTKATLSDAALEAVTRLLPRLPGKRLANRPVGLHIEKGRFGLLARAEDDEPWTLHPVDQCGRQGPDATVFLDRAYLAKAAAFGLGQVSLVDGTSPVQFSRGGDLMVVMPLRPIDPDRIERPALMPAVEQLAPSTTPGAVVSAPRPSKPAGPDQPTKPTRPAPPRRPSLATPSSKRGSRWPKPTRPSSRHAKPSRACAARSMPSARSAAKPSASWAVSEDSSGNCNVAASTRLGKPPDRPAPSQTPDACPTTSRAAPGPGSLIDRRQGARAFPFPNPNTEN